MRPKLKVADLPEVKALYLEGKFSTPQISKLKGCSSTTVQRFLRRNNVSLYRGRPKYFNWNDLYELYVARSLSADKIAEVKGCGRNTVIRALRARGIPVRPPINEKAGKIKKYKWDYEQLHDLYLKQKMTVVEISKLMGRSKDAIRRALVKLDVKIRNSSEARLAKGPSRHISGGYVVVYCPEKRRYIAEHILIWEQVHNSKLPKGWVIHHLNGIRNDNRPENLIALSSQKHRLILAEKAKRIRELETKIKLLERVLDSQQMIWWTEN